MKKIYPITIVMLIILGFYSYSVISTSQRTGMKPFAQKILVCELSKHEIDGDYKGRSTEFKKNYPIFDFPKFIALKLKANGDGEFVSMKWKNNWIKNEEIFVNPYFNYPYTKKFIFGSKDKRYKEFRKFIPSAVNLDIDGKSHNPFPEYINFKIINNEKLFIDYFSVSSTIYNCVITEKPILE